MSRHYYLQSCYDGSVFEWCTDDTHIQHRPDWRGLSHRQALERVLVSKQEAGSSQLAITEYLGSEFNWRAFDKFLASHEQGPITGIKVQGVSSNFSFGLEITLGMEEIYGRACQFHNTQLLSRGNDPMVLVVGALAPGHQAPYIWCRDGADYPGDTIWPSHIAKFDQRIVARYAWSLDP